MRALVTASFHPDALARLRRLMDVVHEDWKGSGKIYFDGAELAERLRAVGADVLIVEADLVHEEVLKGVRLRLVGCCRGDPLNVDVELATSLGVPVFYAPGRNAAAVAELTIAFMLVLARHVFTVSRALAGGEIRFERPEDFLHMYERYQGIELEGRTVGLVGFGAVGRQVARRLAGFSMRVLVYDPYLREVPAGIERVELEPLLRESDFISLHCPEAEETRGLIGPRELALMKPGAYFLNLARGSIVDEDALYQALRDGRLAGAGLDVLQDEPVQPGNRFLALPNVVLTPHLGGATHDVVRHQSEMVVASIEAYLAGRRPPYIANPAVLGGAGPSA